MVINITEVSYLRRSRYCNMHDQRLHPDRENFHSLLRNQKIPSLKQGPIFEMTVVIG